MTIDERISTELRRHVPQVDEQAAWERIRATAPARPGRVWNQRLVLVAAATLGVVLLGFTLVQTFPWDPAPVAVLQSPFRGTWMTSDGDGSTPTMTVEVSDDGVIEITVHDDYASVCSGAASTMTGAGRLEGDTALVIPAPVLTCDDGSEPEALSGPPLEEQLLDLTFTHDPESDTLTDNFGSVWSRESAEDPSPEPTTPEGMWPQSSLEEVGEAQELADAGDPDYTWQLAPEIVSDTAPGDAEIFRRFFKFKQELGWDEYRWGDDTTLLWGGECASSAGCTSYDVGFLRCDVSRPNPVYPDDPEGSTCAPTVDEVTYETVTVRVEQLAARGSSGIWVVTDWHAAEAVRQRVPRSDADVADALDHFLQARVDGEGAEEQVGASSETIPLLYAASNGASYERFDYEAAPRWPTGEFDVTIRLYAEGGDTVVEQRFTLYDAVDRLLLEFDGRSTIENGQPLPEPYSILDGEVTFAVPPPWYGFFDYGPNTIALVQPDLPGDMAVLGVLPDPVPLETVCEPGPVPADAEALALSILSDPDLEATEPVAASVGGIEALQMDVVVANEASICDSGSPEVLTVVNSGGGFGALWLEPGDRMRLYLLDLPEGSSARTLAVTFVAPEGAFETVLEYVQPILESFEFRTG
jgi:hypothetical protein